MFDMWKEELTEQETQNLIEKAANEIQKRKLEVPALLMLEMHKPLAYVGSHAAVALSPMLVPFLGHDNVNNYTRLFSKRDNIERLMQRVEEGRKEAPAKEEA